MCEVALPGEGAQSSSRVATGVFSFRDRHVLTTQAGGRACAEVSETRQAGGQCSGGRPLPEACGRSQDLNLLFLLDLPSATGSQELPPGMGGSPLPTHKAIQLHGGGEGTWLLLEHRPRPALAEIIFIHSPRGAASDRAQGPTAWSLEVCLWFLPAEPDGVAPGPAHPLRWVAV